MDVLPDLDAGPIEEWTQLVKSVVLVPLDEPGVRALRRVLSPHAGDSGGEAGNRAAERLNFADVAAGHAGLRAGTKAVDAVSGDEPLERTGVRVDDADPAVILALEPFEEIVGLLVEPTGVDRKDIDVGEFAAYEVGENYRLGTEAARVRDALVPRQSTDQ